MRAEGLEPPRAEAHQDLNLARLPNSATPAWLARSGLNARPTRAASLTDSMIGAVAVGEVRPGYELWRPNREKASSVSTKFVVVLLLAATAVIAGLITIGGWSLLKGGGGMGIVCAIYALLYAFFAFLVARWNRGILPVAAALSMILAIFCAVGAESWFNRDRAGFNEALLPSDLIGLLVVLLGLLQIVTVAAVLYAFNQEWHVEEERPIGSGEDYGAGASPQPA